MRPASGDEAKPTYSWSPLFQSPLGRAGGCRMAVKTRTASPDKKLRQILDALRRFDKTHPGASIEAYRQNDVSIRIRIVHRDFVGMSRVEREKDVWNILQQLPEDVVAEISMLLLFTPQETKKSLASIDFDDPIPSEL